jgi:ADP-ribose pyrophosphatase YjhB (NUDIX family)
MWIEDAEYQRIVERMPIPTVDAILTFEGRFLLLKRVNPPVQGEWWLPGGRVRKGESLETAVKREVKEETGLTGRIIRQVGVINHIFPEAHTISVYYLVEAESTTVTLNAEHSAYRWVTRLPKDSHPYLQTMINTAGLPT